MNVFIRITACPTRIDPEVSYWERAAPLKRFCESLYLAGGELDFELLMKNADESCEVSVPPE